MPSQASWDKVQVPVQVFLLWAPPYFLGLPACYQPRLYIRHTVSSTAQESRALSPARLSCMPHFRGKEKFREPFPLGDWSGCSDLPTLRGWDVGVDSPHVKGKCLLAVALSPRLHISLWNGFRNMDKIIWKWCSCLYVFFWTFKISSTVIWSIKYTHQEAWRLRT